MSKSVREPYIIKLIAQRTVQDAELEITLKSLDPSVVIEFSARLITVLKRRYGVKPIVKIMP